MEIGTVRQIDIGTEMRGAYLDYAMSVITGRALPDVRDGLKPVQRRILYAMHDMGLRPEGPFKKSARIVGECLVKDTLVATQRGLLPIQDVRRGDMVYTEGGVKPVVELYEMPPRPLVEIELENGLRNVATPSQLFRVLNPDLSFSWKEVKELKPGDWIVLKAGYPDVAAPPPLAPFKGREKVLNRHIAYLLGLLMSDGWVSMTNQLASIKPRAGLIASADASAEAFKPGELIRQRGGRRRRLGFYSAEREIVERIAGLLWVEFGYEATIETKEYIHRSASGRVLLRQGYTVHINWDELNAYFVENFCVADIDALTKHIPPQVLQAPKDTLLAFLSGLIDGDGSVHRERNVIHYGSISSRLIEELHVLLHHLGIPSRRYVEERDGAGDASAQQDCAPRMLWRKEGCADASGEQTFYWLEVTGTASQRLAEGLDLAHPVKRRLLARMRRGATKQFQLDQIPYAAPVLFGELRRHHPGGGWYQDTDGHKFRQGITYPGGAKIRYSQDLRDKPLYASQLEAWGIRDKLERIGSPYAEWVAHILDDHITFAQVGRVSSREPEKTYDLQVAEDHMFVANGMVVHNCLGKYHPHGDQAVYEALVRMAQDFSMRYPLVDGQGNFGSVDGDNPAAMRYTEARMTAMAEEMLADINKETVDFTDNFDGTLSEPTVLPGKLPNLLLSGASGIAVGMATNIPPHNLREVCDALIYVIDNFDSLEDISVDDLLELIKGPDFPTGGLIYRYYRDGEELTDTIRNAYATGKGRVVMRAKVHIEEMPGNRHRIVVTELPYQVNKAGLIEKIAALVRSKRLDGISDLRDESDRHGMSIVIELKRGAQPDQVLNQLLKYTPMQSTFGVNMLALVDGEPRILPLKRVLQYYIDHRREVITRRTRYDLDKAKQRAHILEGLRIALADLNAVIATIRRSRTATTALKNLRQKFKLTKLQAQAILDMPLRRLAALERKKIEEEYAETVKTLAYLQDLLAHPRKILHLIRDDLAELKARYGDPRLTRITAEEATELTEEDLILEEDVLISITQRGYVKRSPISTYRRVMAAREKDVIQHFFAASTSDNVLFFTDQGRVFQEKAHQIPSADRQPRGLPLPNLIALASGESVTAAISVPHLEGKGYLVMATRGGKIKRTLLSEFAAVRPSGLMAIILDEEDELGWVKLTHGGEEIILVTEQGQAIRFSEEEVRPMGRAAGGVMAIKLAKGDRVAGMDIVREGSDLLIVTESGFGKRTPLGEYPTQGRYGQGVRTLDVSKLKQTGGIAAARVVNAQDEVSIISAEGKVRRITVKDIPQIGRAARGSMVASVRKGDALVSVARLNERKEETSPQPEKPQRRAVKKRRTKAAKAKSKAVKKGSKKGKAKK